MKGWGPKSSVCPSKPRETKCFGGISRDFRRDIPGVPEKFEKRKFVFNSCPLLHCPADDLKELPSRMSKTLGAKAPRAKFVQNV